MEDELMRIGVSIPAQLLSEFDAIIKKRGYSSRSEAIRDAIRGYLLDYEAVNQTEGDQVGVISLMYNHEQRGLISLLTDIQHENAQIITSTIHIHLDTSNCLEIDVVRGSARDIRAFADKIIVQSGVYQVRVFVIPTPRAANDKGTYADGTAGMS
ncbi:MAG: nickel-responsive transcriptional regulator NikR [Halobacteriota archaeon]